MTGPTVDRRHAMLASIATGAGLILPAIGRARAAPASSASRAGTCSTPQSAIARTQYGPVRGYVSDGVYIFKGVPYGADTGDENRWLPAKPLERWTETRDTLSYGANSPQTLHDFSAVEHTFLQQWTDGFIGEDMLKLTSGRRRCRESGR